IAFCEAKKAIDPDICVEILSILDLRKKISQRFFVLKDYKGDFVTDDSLSPIITSQIAKKLYDKGEEFLLTLEENMLGMICEALAQTYPEICIDLLSRSDFRNKINQKKQDELINLNSQIAEGLFKKGIKIVDPIERELTELKHSIGQFE